MRRLIEIVVLMIVLLHSVRMFPENISDSKPDPFNVYLNYHFAGVAQLGDANGNGIEFKCKQLRLEIKGDLTERIYYRLRHRLNKSNAAASEDIFAKATDYMMVGYKLSDKWAIRAGKMCQIWGGYEFDDNPIYIYQYSDMVDCLDSPKAGFVLIYRPVSTQEFMAEISNARNEKLDVQFPNIEVQGVVDDKAPLAYIINWNGSFLDNLVQTRWSYGVRTLAKNTYSCQIILGQRLKLPRFQCYVDYSIESDDIDRMGIITREAKVLLPTNKYFYEDVVYNAWVAKADYRLADKWNVYVQGMYETANVSGWEGHLREHIGYFAGLEYYPDKTQDLRFSLSYLGQSIRYSNEIGLKGYIDNRIELGMIYRIKCF